jgi:hypothetical protein
LLTEAYVFGGVLRGADPLEFVEVALVLNLPPDEVVWETTPRGTLWLADYLRLSKGGFAYFWGVLQKSAGCFGWQYGVCEPKVPPG